MALPVLLAAAAADPLRAACLLSQDALGDGQDAAYAILGGDGDVISTDSGDEEMEEGEEEEGGSDGELAAPPCPPSAGHAVHGPQLAGLACVVSVVALLPKNACRQALTTRGTPHRRGGSGGLD
jgi:hypothetical protein